MAIKRYKQFVNESQEALDPSGFEGISSDIQKMIETTIENSDDATIKELSVKEFAEKYPKSPDMKIEGLVNDDQVYDFWLKYENEIDELLNKIKFFSESPDELNSLGTYKYIMTSTKRAITEIVGMLAK